MADQVTLGHEDRLPPVHPGEVFLKTIIASRKAKKQYRVGSHG